MSVGGVSSGSPGWGAGDAGAAPASPEAPSPDDTFRGELSFEADLRAVFDGGELTRGARGDGVRLVQAYLHRAGVDVPGGIDGAFGRGTEAALAQFQRDQAITPSGRLDRETLLTLQGAERVRILPAPEPLTSNPLTLVATDDERDAYASIQSELRTGFLDWAVSDAETGRVLDLLDKLDPASYSRVLHAMAATATGDPKTTTLLDKFIIRGTSEAFNTRLSARFAEQLETKLSGRSAAERKIFAHASPDAVDKLESWSGFARLLDLFR